MTTKPLISLYNSVKKSVANHRLAEALDFLLSMAHAAKAPWQLKSEIETLSVSYGYLRDYAIGGADDPQRSAMLSEICSSILAIADRLLRVAYMPDSSRLYYSILRYESLQPDSSLPALMEQLCSSQAEISMQAFGGKRADDSVAKNQSHLINRIFNFIWTAHPLSSSDEEVLSKALADETIPDYIKELLISAIMLGALHYFDERRLVILASTYLNSTSAKIEMKAFTALILSMWAHRSQLRGKRLDGIIALCGEKASWRADLRQVFLELARTRDTERISRTMTEEIIPKMIKLKPDLYKKLNDAIDPEDFMPMDENPEWADMFEKSGLSEKLREINDLQADGADVMMSTFAQLKSFAFFNDVSAWFTPFYLEHPAIKDIIGGADIGELIASSPMMCDGDKYSIVLTLEKIPAANRRMMLEQFKIQDINLAELRNAELDSDEKTRYNFINKYVQDIYRFFHLFRRKGEFPSPLSNPVNLSTIPMLAPYVDDSDTLAVIAEFYFKRKYWAEAKDLFAHIIELGQSSHDIYQKAGYCLQQLGHVEEAIEFYCKSELLRPNSIWTVKHLAQCYRLVGDTIKATQYYELANTIRPDDLNTILNLGYCRMEAGEYAEALKLFFKVEFLNPKQFKAVKAIAWCAFLSGNFERSRDYYIKVLANNPTASDYLNMGHLQMALKNYREAMNYYKLSAANSTDSTGEALWQSIQADRRYLLKAAVDADIIDIIADAVAREL